MHHDQKVQDLAGIIAPHVSIDSVREAEQIKNSFRLPESAAVPRQIRSIAEHLIEHADRLNIRRFLDRHSHPRVHISVVEEAIRLVAQQYVEQSVRPASRARTVTV